ncbi:hypothetical protein GJ744_006007 [Endocarpon pusillum]|uniref:Uncharacterized protein n=1 Tax=Endocarpon pusillum TaxID=364733 RepID=A0A8H7A811_9EURO|nr:hypothetical protein GJ744_006007 [Endocarpon pusillum]
MPRGRPRAGKDPKKQDAPLPSQSEQSISLESSSQRPRTSSWLKAEAERHQQEQPVLKTRKHSLSTETGGIVADENPETAPSKSTGERAATPSPKPVQCKGRYTIEDLYPEENRRKRAQTEEAVPRDEKENHQEQRQNIPAGFYIEYSEMAFAVEQAPSWIHYDFHNVCI